MVEIGLRSAVLRQQVAEGRIAIAGAMYDVRSGRVDFLDEPSTAA